MSVDDKLSAKPQVDTTDFKTGIQAMGRELRVLKSDFAASAASMGDWSKDATGLESRIKSLNSQIEVQQRVVAANRAEYNRLVEAQGAESRAAQEQQIKLNKSVETLGKMQNELGTTEQSLQDMKTGEQQTGDAAQNMGGDIQGATTAVEGMEAAMAVAEVAVAAVVAVITALGAAAVAAVGGITDLVFSAAEAGSQLQDMSDKTGIGTERLQELGFIGKQVGTDLDTITGANARLIRSMFSAKDGTGTQAKAFQELGVRVTDANGNLRDSQTVLNNVIDALGRVKNPAEADALAMEIFGKSAQELNPLIKLGSKGMAEMAGEAHKLGAVMSADSVSALDAFDDKMSGLQDGIRGTLGTLATAFLPVFNELADVFLTNINPAIQNFITLATEYLKPVIGEIVDIIGQFASGDIRGGLARFFGVENADAILNLVNIVKDFLFNVLVPFFASNAGEIRSELNVLISGILTLTTFLIRGAQVWVEAWIQFHNAVSAVWSFIEPVFNALFGWLTTALPAGVQTLSAIWTSTLLPAIQTIWGFLQKNVFPLFQAINGFLGAVLSLTIRALAGIWQNVFLPPILNVVNTIRGALLPVFQTLINYLSAALGPVLSGLAAFLRNALIPAFHGIASAIASVVNWLRTMTAYLNTIQLPSWMTPGSPTPWEIGLVGVHKAMQDLNRQIPQLQNNLQFQTAPQFAVAGADSRAQPTRPDTRAVNNTSNQNITINIQANIRDKTDIDVLTQKIKQRLVGK